MSDEIDNLLRRAMSTLDREVPDGYFDALPDRTLARLDGPDELARERAARGVQARPAPSSEPVPVAVTPRDPPAVPGRDAGTARRRPRRVLVATLGVGLAAAVVVLWVSSSTERRAPATAHDESPRLERHVVPARGTEPRQVPQIATDDRPAVGPPAPSAPPPTGLAAPAPTLEDFVAALSAVATRTETCFPGTRTAKVVLEVTVRSSGEIAEAHLMPPFTGTAMEACIRRVVALLRFPSWTGPAQTFRYPFPALSVP